MSKNKPWTVGPETSDGGWSLDTVASRMQLAMVTRQGHEVEEDSRVTSVGALTGLLVLQGPRS